MARVDAVTAKASIITKNFIALSSSVKSAKGRKRQLPAPHLATEPKWSRSNAHHRTYTTYGVLFGFLIIKTGSDVSEHAD